MVKATCPCGREFAYERGRGRPRKYCDECRRVDVRPSRYVKKPPRQPAIPEKCSVEGCHAQRLSRGWCNKHYLRWRIHGDLSFTNRREGPPRREALCEVCAAPFESKRRSDGRWTRYCSKSCARKAEYAAGAHALRVVNGAQIGRDPEKVRRNGELATRKRRARLRGVEREPYTRAEIAERDGYRCWLCNRRVDMTLEYPHSRSASIDHVVPLSLPGATDTRDNVRLAHLGENLARGNRVEWAQQLLIG